MLKWTWIVVVIIVGSIILSIGLGLTANSIRVKNLHEEEENNLQFFNMNLPSNEGDASDLTISCPDWPLKDPDIGSVPQHNQAVVNEIIGKKPQTFKIEILGAYFDVFDPWGQCSPEPSDLIMKTCQEDADNNKGLCSNLIKTVENDSLTSQWFRNTICGSKYQDGHGYGGKANNKQGNNTESYGETDYVCRLQDATPFLSARCNGKKECIINLKNPDDVRQVFGSMPCYYKMSGSPLTVKDEPYKHLPSDKRKGKSFQQGYVVKGIYRCVPNYE